MRDVREANGPTSPDVEALEVRLFLEGIHARYGYDLRGYSTGSIRRRVAAALARSPYPNIGALQHAVLHDPAVFASILDDLTVRVTEMFRDPGLFRALRERVVPVLRTYPLLRIWHAGCATGEEVYADAIVLTEEGLYDRTQLYASDINQAALTRARLGTYGAETASTLARNYTLSGGKGDVAAHYDAAYDGIAMKDRLRRNILFLQHDLVCDQVFGEMHVVFCRNVLIYFGPELRARVLGKIAQSLCPGGFLCLGSSERLIDLTVPGQPGAVFREFDGKNQIYRYEG